MDDFQDLSPVYTAFLFLFQTVCYIYLGNTSQHLGNTSQHLTDFSRQRGGVVKSPIEKFSDVTFTLLEDVTDDYFRRLSVCVCVSV